MNWMSTAVNVQCVLEPYIELSSETSRENSSSAENTSWTDLLKYTYDFVNVHVNTCTYIGGPKKWSAIYLLIASTVVRLR